MYLNLNGLRGKLFLCQVLRRGVRKDEIISSINNFHPTKVEGT